MTTDATDMTERQRRMDECMRAALRIYVRCVLDGEIDISQELQAA